MVIALSTHAGQISLTVLEEELRTLSSKENQQGHSLLAWQKVPDSARADEEITRLQAQVLLEKAKGDAVSKMLESTCNALRCALDLLNLAQQ